MMIKPTRLRRWVPITPRPNPCAFLGVRQNIPIYIQLMNTIAHQDLFAAFGPQLTLPASPLCFEGGVLLSNTHDCPSFGAKLKLRKQVHVLTTHRQTKNERSLFTQSFLDGCPNDRPPFFAQDDGPLLQALGASFELVVVQPFRGRVLIVPFHVRCT